MVLAAAEAELGLFYWPVVAISIKPGFLVGPRSASSQQEMLGSNTAAQLVSQTLAARISNGRLGRQFAITESWRGAEASQRPRCCGALIARGGPIAEAILLKSA